MHITTEVIDICVKAGDIWESCTYSEELTKILEIAFGWDSIEAAEAYRHVSIIS